MIQGPYQVLKDILDTNKAEWIFYDSTGRLLATKEKPEDRMLKYSEDYYDLNDFEEDRRFSLYSRVPLYVPSPHFIQLGGFYGPLTKLIDEKPKLIKDVLGEYEYKELELVWVLTKEVIGDCPLATVILKVYNNKPNHLDIYRELVKGNEPTNSQLKQIELILDENEEHVIVGKSLYQLVRMPVSNVSKE